MLLDESAAQSALPDSVIQRPSRIRSLLRRRDVLGRDNQARSLEHVNSGETTPRQGHTFGGSNISGNARVHFGDHYENVTYNLVYDVYKRHSLSIDTSERIGVLASIPGLWALTGAVYAQLNDLASMKDQSQSRLFYDTAAAVGACKISLETFRRRITFLDTSSDRAALIKVDKLVILFTHAILLFDELRTLLSRSDPLNESHIDLLQDLLDRTRDQNWAWGLQEFILSRHVPNSRIERASPDEPSPSEDAAVEASLKLDKISKKLLAGNETLCQRIYDYSDQVQDTASQRLSMAFPDHMDIAETEQNTTVNVDSSIATNRLTMTPADFERALSESWVYQRTQERVTSMSFRSSVSFGWSELSQLSLSDVSVLSVICLPVQISQLAHGQWYAGAENDNAEEIIHFGLQHPAAGNHSIRPDEHSAARTREDGFLRALDLALPSELRTTTRTSDDGDSIKTHMATTRLSEDGDSVHISVAEDLRQQAPFVDLSEPDAQSSNDDSAAAEPSELPQSPPDVLFVCASLFEFKIDPSRKEGQYGYLSYVCGEVFDVVAQKRELWLARNQDDPSGKLGWIWEQHFAILSKG